MRPRGAQPSAPSLRHPLPRQYPRPPNSFLPGNLEAALLPFVSLTPPLSLPLSDFILFSHCRAAPAAPSFVASVSLSLPVCLSVCMFLPLLPLPNVAPLPVLLLFVGLLSLPLTTCCLFVLLHFAAPLFRASSPALLCPLARLLLVSLWPEPGGTATARQCALTCCSALLLLPLSNFLLTVVNPFDSYMQAPLG
jgi:hypothetical protein